MRQVSAGGVAGGALACTAKVGCPSGRVAGKHVLDLQCRAQRVVNLLMESVGEVLDLCLGQLRGWRGLGGVSLTQKRTDRAAVAIMQQDLGADEIGAFIPSAGMGAVAGAALGGINETPAIGGSLVHYMFVGRSGRERGTP